MADNVSLIVNETIDNVVINPGITTQVIDVNVTGTDTYVDINVTPSVTIVNINEVTGGGGGSQNLQQVTDIGNSTTNSITANSFIKSSGTASQFLMADGTTTPISNINSKQLQLNYLDRDNSIFDAFYLRTIADGSTVEASNQLLSSLAVLTNISYVSQGYTQQINADKFVKLGGAADEFLMADGSTSTGGGGGGATNLTTSQTSTNFTINSDTGTDASVPLGNGTLAGATLNDYTTAEKALVATIPNVNTNAIDRDTVKLGEAINKGQAVYVSDANGTNIIVSKASNISEALSSKTFGLLETTGFLNDIVNVVTSGLLSGLNTNTATIGDAVWLGTSGNLIFGLTNKPVAPANLVYIGIVTRVSATVGEIFISIQNGFELSEIHDILLTSVANNEGLFYDSTTLLWKNKSISTALGYTPANDTTVVHKTGNENIAGIKTFGSSPKIPTNPTNGTTAGVVIDDGTGTIQAGSLMGYPSGTELTYVKGVTSSIQTQLNLDASATQRGAVTTGTQTFAGFKTFSSAIKIPANPTNSAGAIVIDSDGLGSVVPASNLTYPNLTELTYVKGVTSAIQTQFTGKQATLISATNIKTVNGNTLLGSGDLVISGSSAQTGTIIVTSGTSFTTPSTITTSTVFIIELVGAGGGGAGGLASNGHGSAGGGGGYIYEKITGLSPSTTYTCAIGTGGAGGAAVSNGTAGGSTTLTIGGATFTASGGGFGIATLGAAGGAGGTGTATGATPDIAITGQNGDYTALTTAATVHSSRGGGSPKGWGLGGAGVGQSFNGLAGSGYGGGGSSGKGGTFTGGAGSNGIIYCQYYN